jgi:adenylate cyclase
MLWQECNPYALIIRLWAQMGLSLVTGGRVERRLAAVLAADVAGYSRLMGADEVGTARTLREHRVVTDALVSKHGGRIVKTTGDGVLLEFPSVVDAVECAVAVQAVMAERNEGVPAERRMLFRIGINLGDILIEGDDILGDGVNIAARIENECEPGGVYLSGDAYRQVRGKTPFVFDDLGEKSLKNIDQPVRLYAVRSASFSTEATVKAPAEADKPLPLPDKPSIAVLPFQNMSGDPEQEYFADGMVEDITTALSRFKSLFVIARNSSFTYKGKAVDVKQVGRELGVRYVLEGSVRRAGKRVRITGQLIEVANGTHIWAGRFDRELEDVFALQDELAQAVVSAVEPNLRSAEIARKKTVPTENLAAYDLYLRAIPELDPLTKDGLERAEALLRRAIQLDPHYSDAWAALADALGRQIVGNWKTVAELAPEAQQAALRAVKVDPENGEALGAAAWALAVLGGPLDQAADFARRAVVVHPNSAGVRAHCGWALVFSGELEEALANLEAGQRMDPLGPRFHITQNAMSAAYFFQRKFDKALELARGVLARVPTHHVSLRFAAASLVHLGRLDEARATIQQLRHADPDAAISRTRAHFRHQWMNELYIDALRAAGLPE